jgi:hypothetical protein
MCGRTYGQTNMKRATTLTKINPPWNQYTMCMLRSCVRRHILCTQLVICLLSHFIHIWYLGWPRTEHAHIIPISRMVDFARVVALDRGQSRYQIWIKCDKRQMTSCVHKMCGRTYGQTNMKRATTLAKSTIREIGIICHLSCRILFIFGSLVGHVLSMRIEYRFHGWLLFARVIALLWSNKHEKGYNSCKINHPWNRYNMCMLSSWPTKIPNMNKMRQKTND